MGMYNEVLKTCPNCGGRGVMQIHQIVLGFGSFNLDNLDSIAKELDVDAVKELVEAVKRRKWFNCEGECKGTFLYNGKLPDDEKRHLLNELINE